MDDNANDVVQIVDDEDLNTTAPNPPMEWQMPAPVFRKTSGKLPQGYEKEIERARAEQAASDPEPSNAAISESANSSTPEPQPKSSTLKLVLVLLGLAAMIGFLIVFLTVVYIFFLR